LKQQEKLADKGKQSDLIDDFIKNEPCLPDEEEREEEEKDEEVKTEIKAKLELEEGDSVDVKVKAEGLKPGETFKVRAYSSTDCAAGTLLGGSAVGSDTADDEGKIKISGTVSGEGVSDVNSVSIRDTPDLGQIVVCFQDTTP